MHILTLETSSTGLSAEVILTIMSGFFQIIETRAMTSNPQWDLEPFFKFLIEVVRVELLSVEILE